MAQRRRSLLPGESWRGLPNVVVEALACGRPVAGCDVGGIPELVNADCGVLAPPSDPPALAEAIARALDTNWQPDLIARVSRAVGRPLLARPLRSAARCCGALASLSRPRLRCPAEFSPYH